MKIFASQFTEVLTFVDVRNEILWWSLYWIRKWDKEYERWKGLLIIMSSRH